LARILYSATGADGKAVDGFVEAAGMAEVDGETTGDHPVPAVVEIVRRLNADEVVVLTEPHLVTDLIRRDWATRLRHELDLPVLHVVLGTDQVVS